MDALELCYMSATQLAAEIRAKAVSPVEVVTEILARIDSLEPTLNAFATLTPELALEAARTAEKAVMAGDALGELHGIPVTIKDLTLTAGIPTQRGSNIFSGYTIAEDRQQRFIRSASRFSLTPDVNYGICGFRVALAPTID